MADRNLDKKKNTNFREISFKLSERQIQSLQNYCEARKTTPVKLIKKNIRRYLEYETGIEDDKSDATRNQLELFKDPMKDDNKGIQADPTQLDLF